MSVDSLDSGMSDGAIYAAISDKLHLKEMDALRAEIERLRAALKEIQAYSVGDPRPRHTWYYDRADAALNYQQRAGEK